jgi:hypothetical protein
LTFEEYVERLRREVAWRDEKGGPTSRGARSDLYALNLRRMERLMRFFHPRPETCALVDRVRYSQLWMVLSEVSCGDSAQSIPVLAAIARLNPLITLRVLFRDENLDIMDQYLTNGTRGIPKLVAFTEGGAELFQWGPRPEPARTLFAQGRVDGLSKGKILERIHLFYGRDGGRSVEAEIAALLATD